MRARALLGLAVALAAAAPAHAADGVVASVRGRNYAPRRVPVFEGERLVLLQADPFERHDVVAIDRDPVTDEPLFANEEPLRFAEYEPVARVELLEPGLYPFTCSIHEEMQGLLEVLAD